MTVLDIRNAGKTFTMHLQGGLRLPVVQGVSFRVMPGECVVLAGPSGCGKSSILKMIFGSYRCGEGPLVVDHGGVPVDLARAEPRQVLALRRSAIGYVSQFLRAVPRVAAIDVVAEPLVNDGIVREQARERAGGLLARLNIASRLWELPPATFSGGEQQRVNIARGFLPERPVLLLDEPTASLDAANRKVVIDLIHAKKSAGTAIVAIVHDDEVRDAIADTIVDITQFTAAA
jgi:alpha-D-ribose 1-methylphosphonate 5-triphosphate synthase subunit PhnL